MGRGFRARPVRRGARARVPGPAQAGHPVDREPAAAAVQPARGRRRPAGRWPASTPGELAAFAEACADRELAEERRLAYVAATRAAFWLGCSGYWWGNGLSRLGPSVFLAEVRAACEAGAGGVAVWADEPDEDAQNPALAEPATAPWPAAASGSRYEAVREAGELVTAAIAARGEPGTGRGPGPGTPVSPTSRARS